MDNVNSLPTIKTVSVPSDAEAQAGTTITGLIKYILYLVEKSKIIGIDEENPLSGEIEALQKDMQVLKNDMAEEKRMGVFIVSVPGTTGGSFTVPLPTELDSNIYQVDMSLSGPAGAIPTHEWSVITGSKTKTQFQVQTTGNLTGYSLDFAINLL